MGCTQQPYPSGAFPLSFNILVYLPGWTHLAWPPPPDPNLCGSASWTFPCFYLLTLIILAYPLGLSLLALSLWINSCHYQPTELSHPAETSLLSSVGFNLLAFLCPELGSPYLPAVYNLLALLYWPSQPGPPNLALLPRVVFECLCIHFGGAGIGAWSLDHARKQLLTLSLTL